MFPNQIEPLSSELNSNLAGPTDEFEFRKLAAKVSQNTKKMSEHVSAIESIISKIGTSKDNISLQEDLQRRQSEASSLARTIKEQLWSLSSMSSTSASSTRDQQRLHAQVETLGITFSSALRTLQNAQEIAARKERASVTMFKRKVEDATPLISMPFDSDTHSQDQSLQRDLVPLEELRTREEAIRQIESDIKGVNDIFKELASMVHEQGDVLDSIEAHVETTASNVENANAQLLIASKHQTSSRKKLFIFFSIILVVAIISAIVIYFSTRKH